MSGEDGRTGRTVKHSTIAEELSGHDVFDTRRMVSALDAAPSVRGKGEGDS